MFIHGLQEQYCTKQTALQLVFRKRRQEYGTDKD